MTHGVPGGDLPAPELPTPITTPDPVETDPVPLPVEPELDPTAPANKSLSATGRMAAKQMAMRLRPLHTAVALRFPANRQFMRAAAFRWPDPRASMHHA